MTTQNRSTELKSVFGILFLLIVLWSLLAAASYLLVVIPSMNRFDFYPRWVGSRAALLGENPYSDQVTWRIQEGEFGRRLEAWEDQQRFAYFPFVIWLLLPFWLLPFPLAISLWSGLQLLLLLVLPILVAITLGWKIRPLKLVILLLFSVVVFRYPIIAYLIGQFIPWCLVALVIAWWGLVNNRPILTAVALLLGLIRPELTFLSIFGLLLLAWEKKNKLVILAWGVGTLGMLVITSLRVGPWVMDFLHGLRAYQEYSAPVWAPQLLDNSVLAAALILVVLIWGPWMWRSVRIADIAERGGWILAITSLTVLILLPQTGNYSLVMGLTAVWMIFWTFDNHRLMWLLVLILLSSPWFFHSLGTERSILEHLIIPVLLGVLLTLSWLTRSNEIAERSQSRMIPKTLVDSDG